VLHLAFLAPGRLVLLVHRPEPRLGAMEQHPQMPAIAPETLADGVLRAVVEKQPAEQRAIFRRQPLEGLANLETMGRVDERRLGIRGSRRRVVLVVDQFMPSLPLRSIGLEQDVVAHGVYERSETARHGEPPLFPECRQHAKEGFLFGVLYKGGRSKPPAELSREELPKILAKMPFSLWIGCGETFDICRVECVTRDQSQQAKSYTRVVCNEPAPAITSKQTQSGITFQRRQVWKRESTADRTS
jgi:hypothetical protein